MFNKLFKRKPKRTGDVYKLYDDTVRIDLEPKYKNLWKIYVLDSEGKFIKQGQTADLEEAFQIAETLKGIK